MATLIQVDNNYYVNIDQVVSIQEKYSSEIYGYNKKWILSIKTSGGLEYTKIFDTEVDRIEFMKKFKIIK